MCIPPASKDTPSAQEGRGEPWPEPTIDQLREQVRGDIIAPDDGAYEEARKVYNAMIDKRPAVVVRPVNAGDVIAAVNFARENGIDLAIHGARTVCRVSARVTTGCRRPLPDEGGPRRSGEAHGPRGGRRHVGRLQRCDPRLRARTTGGILSTTGVGGLTLGGGIGYLARGLGLSCDNLISADS
jgi:hypothetical protein